MTTVLDLRSSPRPLPRVALVGERAGELGAPDAAWRDALAEEAEVVDVPVTSPFFHIGAARRQIAAAVRNDGAEVVHVQDVRFVPAALLALRTTRTPVTCDIASRDLRSRSPLLRLSVRLAERLDQGFCFDAAGVRALRRRAPRMPVVRVPPVASIPVAPSSMQTRAIVRALGGVSTGRPIVGLAWPRERSSLLKFRDFVLPRLAAKPLCVAFGVQDVRSAHRSMRLAGAQYSIRIGGAPLTPGAVSAVARCADVIAVLPGPLAAPDDQVAAAVALASSGVPVVSWESDLGVLHHEENAMIARDASAWAYVRLLDQALGLPSLQRHFLGEEFRRATIASWPVREAARVYGERFSTLTGRTRIPEELRAA